MLILFKQNSLTDLIVEILTLQAAVAFASWLAVVVLALRWPFEARLQSTVGPRGILKRNDL